MAIWHQKRTTNGKSYCAIREPHASELYDERRVRLSLSMDLLEPAPPQSTPRKLRSHMHYLTRQSRSSPIWSTKITRTTRRPYQPNNQQNPEARCHCYCSLRHKIQTLCTQSINLHTQHLSVRLESRRQCQVRTQFYNRAPLYVDQRSQNKTRRGEFSSSLGHGYSEPKAQGEWLGQHWRKLAMLSLIDLILKMMAWRCKQNVHRGFETVVLRYVCG